MSEVMSPVEHLQFWIVRNGMDRHPSGKVFCDVVEQFDVMARSEAQAREELADSRRNNADMHDSLMTVLEQCIPLINAGDYPEVEAARAYLIAACEHYGVVNR